MGIMDLKGSDDVRLMLVDSHLMAGCAVIIRMFRELLIKVGPQHAKRAELAQETLNGLNDACAPVPFTLKELRERLASADSSDAGARDKALQELEKAIATATENSVRWILTTSVARDVQVPK